MRRLALTFSTLILFAGCETTGNPREGGIFWSEEKAQQRLDARKRELRRLDSDTDRLEDQSRDLRRGSDYDED
jgi:hypothetical protein